MEQTTVKAIELSIGDLIKRNNDIITEKLFHGCSEHMTESQIFAKISANCVHVSTSLAVQVVLSLLQDAQVIGLDERQIAKLLLKQLSSDQEN